MGLLYWPGPGAGSAGSVTCPANDSDSPFPPNAYTLEGRAHCVHE